LDQIPSQGRFEGLSTALSALRKTGISQRPEEHLVLIRSWKTSTLLASKAPFTAEEIEKVLVFNQRRSF